MKSGIFTGTVTNINSMNRIWFDTEINLANKHIYIYIYIYI